MKNIIRVFVYGTLKRGKRLNESYMKNSEFKQEDHMKGELYSLGGYPGLFKKGKELILGEIWDMPSEDFEPLKRMEEGAGYKTEEAITTKGEKVNVFFYQNEGARIPTNKIKVF